jgi:uncharacterized DUF497 family protein
MKYFTWNNDKNQWLKAERGVSFEEVVFNIDRGNLLDIIKHANQEKYRGQRVFIVQMNDYAYLVPFVEDEREIFLKTIIPSRKATKKYLHAKEEGV